MSGAQVYLKYCSAVNAYKVGVSKNSKKRNKALQTGNPYEIETKFLFFSQFPYRVETALHREFKPYKKDINDIQLKGEWFNLNDNQVNSFLTKCELIESNIKFLVESGNYFILK